MANIYKDAFDGGREMSYEEIKKYSSEKEPYVGGFLKVCCAGGNGRARARHSGNIMERYCKAPPMM